MAFPNRRRKTYIEGTGKDEFAEVLKEQSDWRTAIDPLAEAVAKAFGVEALARGDGFERRECFDVAAALRRSLPSYTAADIIEGMTVIQEYIDKGVHLTPRYGFWYIVQRVRETKLQSASSDIMKEWEQINSLRDTPKSDEQRDRISGYDL